MSANSFVKPWFYFKINRKGQHQHQFYFILFEVILKLSIDNVTEIEIGRVFTLIPILERENDVALALALAKGGIKGSGKGELLI